jgi:hypothetical protein
MKNLMLLILIAAPAFAQERIPETGTFWRWSDPAPHHAAAVKVAVADGAGSGVCVQTEPAACFVLTNNHVVGRSPYAKVTWQSGYSAQGEIVRTLADPVDLALIYVRNPPPGWVSCPIAASTPPVGTELEMVGFGGPQYGRARNFTAPRVESDLSDRPVAMGAPSISGDSGSGILCSGAIVGINFGGPMPTKAALSSSGQQIGLVYPASSGCSAEFLGQWLTGICEPMGCQPRIQGPQINMPIYGQPQVPRSDEQFYPPVKPITPVSPIAPINPQPIAPICPPIDSAKLADDIAAKLASNPALRGKDGPSGPPGPPGPGLSDEQLAQIALAAAKIAQQNLPPLTLILRDPDGKILDQDTIPIGGKLDLQLITQPK